MGKVPKYDWADAILSVVSAKSEKLVDLAKAAKLDPYSGDLSDIDLSNLDLSGQDFSGWDLCHAKFRNANLFSAELRGAKVDVSELIKAKEWRSAQLDDDVRGLAEGIEGFGFNPDFLVRMQDLEFSVRATNCLKADNIVYVGDLVQKTEAEVLRMPNMGRKALNEIKQVLAQMGLHLGMEVHGWPPKNIVRLAQLYKARSAD